MKFEGEYLNGKRNGIGKEYKSHFDGSLEYKGGYLSGKRHGKGKEFFSNGEQRCEWEYFYGESRSKERILDFIDQLLSQL